MTRRRQNNRTTRPDQVPAEHDHATTRDWFALDVHSLIERFTLLVLLALIPLRAVLAETHTFELLGMFRHLDLPSGAQAATTFTIVGCIIAIAAILLCIGIQSGRRRYRRTGAELGAALLLIAAIISTSLAGQKHLALIGVLDLLGGVLYLIVLRQLLRRPWQVRLALVVIVATAAMTIAKCAHQHFVELPDTLEYYESHKAELMPQDSPTDDGSRTHGMQHDFEQRMRSGSLSGYYGHPNILGSHLILFLFATIAILSARRRENRPVWMLLLPIVIVIGCAVALYATRSKGAMVACGLALLVWIVGQGWARSLARRPRTVLTALCLSAVVGCTGLYLMLRTNPAALGRSILFRSMYWQGAREIIADQGLLGVGANQFGRHFTRYKSVECPEEVESPHSWVVRFATEWGVIGLAGILLLFLGVAMRLAGQTPGGSILPHDDFDATPTRGPPGSIILWCGGIGLIVFGAWFALLAGSDPGYRAMVFLIGAIPFAIGFVALAVESMQSTRLADDTLGPLLPALCAGLIGFVLHTGIDLALFATGPATTFFAMIAVTLAVRECRTPDPTTQHTETANRPSASRLRFATVVGLTVMSALVLVVYSVRLVFPAVHLAKELQTARTKADPSPWHVYTVSMGYRAYRAGMNAYPLDATATGELIEQLLPRAGSVEQVDEALTLADEFQLRDRHSGRLHSYRAMLYRRRYDFSKDADDLRRSIEAQQAFVAAYPTSPRRRIDLAALLEFHAEQGATADARTKAAHQLQTALNLDAQRIYVSKPNRLTAKQIATIEERIRRLATP